MKMLKELKWEAILTGVLYILLGIVALVIPETMQKTCLLYTSDAADE